MKSEMFNIFGLSVKWYAFFIAIGVFLGYFLANKEAKKKGYPDDFMLDLTFWVVIIGILCARIYYVIFNFGIYKNNLIEVFKIWHGGLAIHGGIIGGAITLIVFCKKNKCNFLEVADIAVISLILGQAIGRWGNFFNSEAHGPITSLENLKALKIIPNFVINGMKINGIYYQPTFYYESLWCLIGFILLLLIRKFFKELKTGQLTCVYFMWYGVGRFFIEQLRTDSLMLGNIKVAQLVSVCTFLGGLIFFIILSFINVTTKNKKVK